jgi:hypothetical protein
VFDADLGGVVGEAADDALSSDRVVVEGETAYEPVAV